MRSLGHSVAPKAKLVMDTDGCMMLNHFQFDQNGPFHVNLNTPRATHSETKFACGAAWLPKRM